MTRKELYNICHDEAVAYANSEQWSKRTGEEKSFLIQGYLDAMMEARKSEITEKKKEYPKTYKECCRIMDIDTGFLLTSYDLDFWKGHLLTSLQKLLICRDAYWKIAGEEMGLGKPWEPTMETVYCISRNYSSYRGGKSNILEFPTAEMRDAFYENFKSEIEICKELL